MVKEKGWQCPRCDRVWAPTTPGCLHCNHSNQQKTQEVVERNEGMN